VEGQIAPLEESVLEKIATVYRLLRNPLQRSVWIVSLFTQNRFVALRIYAHCFFNVHQLGTIVHQTPDKKPFMVQNFCAACRPDVLLAIKEQYEKSKGIKV
jgi:hypothetical protein